MSEKIERQSTARITVLTQSTPPEGFLTYTAEREEEVIPAYATRVAKRRVVGPIFMQSPGQKIRSVVTVETENFSGDGTLMVLANAHIEYTPQERRAGRVVLYHEFARDDENDRSQILQLEMDMAEVRYIDGTRVRLNAWITEANFFERGDSGTGSRGDSKDIFTAVRKDDSPEDEGGEGYYANSGYPFLGPKKTSILGHKLPLRVTITQHTGPGLGKWFRKQTEKENG